jgi:hypothetical protein
MTETTNLAWLKLAAALVALAAGIGAVVTAFVLAHETPSAGSTSSGPQAASASSPPPAGTRFPVPPRDAVTMAQEDDDLAVGLAARSDGTLQASVVGQESPASGLSVSFRPPGGPTVRASACGPGCYRARVPKSRSVQVAISGRGRAPSTLTFTLPAAAPDAAPLVRRAERTWRSLKTLIVHDHLASSPQNAITTLWQFAAPDRQTYAIVGGPQAVVIGDRRWDRLPGHGWQASSQSPIREPVPLWEAVTNAHVLGTPTVRGRPTWEISFFDPQIQAWFTMWVDRRTARTLELRMTAQAHFMHQVYGPFDSPLRIVPPKKAST